MMMERLLIGFRMAYIPKEYQCRKVDVIFEILIFILSLFFGGFIFGVIFAEAPSVITEFMKVR